MNIRLQCGRHLPVPPRAQQGAALLVSLIILVMLSLLAISASQVTSLQEKMVQAYWSDVRAFEAAEERLRARERTLRRLSETDDCPVLDDSGAAPEWMNTTTRPSSVGNHSAILGRNEWKRGSGVHKGNAIGPLSAVDCAYYMISSADSDTREASDANSWAVVQSIFVP